MYKSFYTLLVILNLLLITNTKELCFKFEEEKTIQIRGLSIPVESFTAIYYVSSAYPICQWGYAIGQDLVKLETNDYELIEKFEGHCKPLLISKNRTIYSRASEGFIRQYHGLNISQDSSSVHYTRQANSYYKSKGSFHREIKANEAYNPVTKCKFLMSGHLVLCPDLDLSFSVNQTSKEGEDGIIYEESDDKITLPQSPFVRVSQNLRSKTSWALTKYELLKNVNKDQINKGIFCGVFKQLSKFNSTKFFGYEQYSLLSQNQHIEKIEKHSYMTVYFVSLLLLICVLILLKTCYVLIKITNEAWKRDETQYEPEEIRLSVTSEGTSEDKNETINTQSDKKPIYNYPSSL